MKNRHFLHVLMVRFGLAFLLTMATLNTARSQGFFTSTDTAYYWTTVYFDTLPGGGHRLQTLHYHPIADVVYYVGTMDLDAQGAIVAWDAVEYAGDINSAYQRLPDGDMAVLHALAPGVFNEVEVVDINGDGLGGWTFDLLPPVFPTRLTAEQNEQSEVFLHRVAPHPTSSNNRLETLYKFDPTGQLLWTAEKAIPYDSIILPLILLPTTAGGSLLYTANTYGLRLDKYSATGQLEWADTTTLAYPVSAIVENNLGGFYRTGYFNNINDEYRAFLTSFSDAGQVLWEKDLNQLFSKHSVIPAELTAALDGGLLLTGSESDNGSSFQPFFARFDVAGNLLWKHHYGFISFVAPGYIVGSRATPENGFILAGFYFGENYVIKIGANGNVYPGVLSGQVADDANFNCQIDGSEAPLANRIVQLTNDAGFSAYTTTDSTGHYAFDNVPGGAYRLFVTLPSGLWGSCADTVNVTVPDSGFVQLTYDFPIQVLALCPLMTVDLSTIVLRRCFPTTITAQYCNDGTVATNDAAVAVVLDPLLTVTGASLPYTMVGDTLFFAPGHVEAGACGNFTITALVSCDAELGQTLCASASITPDTICNPPTNWSGALLEGSGWCVGDSAHFQLRNIGSATTSSGLQFVIIEDHVIMSVQPVPPLVPNETAHYAVAANGATYRLVADQEPQAPGNEMPSVAVEGCGPGAPQWGFFLQFPNRDGNPFTDRLCLEVVGAYDPNDKQAFPTGVKSEHFLEPNTPLEYLIRFQNTGTDTAFTVVIRDTLSPWLDPASVRPGPASHPYTWSLSGPGILKFTFANIMLPDSNINEPASHGYVQFGIDQRPDNPLGAIVENRAGIYFDFNAPIITNTVFHTIGIDFLTSSTWSPPSVPALAVWPNPAVDAVTLAPPTGWSGPGRLVMRNALGQVVRVQAIAPAQPLLLHRDGLPAGLYFLELLQGNRLGAAGRVVWK